MWRRAKHLLGSYLPALRSYNYRLYFVGQGISLVGWWMAVVAEQWLVYPTLTDNRALLGIVSFINLTPTTLLVLFGGALADRLDRKKLLVATQMLFAMISFTLAGLVFARVVAVWHVMVAAFISGLVFALDMPVRQSFMVGLVEHKDFPSALSLNAAIFNGARAIGPAIGGTAIAALGIAPAYFFNAISFFAVIGAIYLMKLPKTETLKRGDSVLEEIKEGISYLWSHKVLAVLLALLFTVTLTTWPIATLLPVFAHDIFGKGEIGFGLLQGFFGVGAFVGALGFSTLFTAVKNKYRLLIGGLILITGYLAAASFAGTLPLMLVFQAVGGWAVVTVISTVNTLLQSAVPDSLRGRALSFYSLVLIGGMPLGALLASLGVDMLGPRRTVLINAVLLAVLSWVLIIATGGKLREKLKAMV